MHSPTLGSSIRVIAKDWLSYRRFLPVAAALFLAYGLAVFVATELYLTACTIAAIVLAWAPVFLDARSRTDLMLVSLPISRSSYVIGRYLSTAAISAVVAWLAAGYGLALESLVADRTTPFSTGWVPGVPLTITWVTIVATAWFYPFALRFGPGKGSMVCAACCIGLIAILVLVELAVTAISTGSLEGFAPLATPRRVASIRAWFADTNLAWSGLVMVAAGLPVSIMLSIRGYRRRDF